MGLDIMEFVVAVEEAHNLTIPDEDLERIHTPRMLIDCLYRLLGHSTRTNCLSQRGFYALRREVAGRTGLPTRALRPATELRPLMTGRRWAELGPAFGEKLWARLWYRGWLFGWRVPKTLGLAAHEMAVRAASCLMPPGENVVWNEIARVVSRLMREHLAVYEYSLDDRFTEDLGIV